MEDCSETKGTPLATAPCSPIETPETDEAWKSCLEWCAKRNESHDPHHTSLANLAEKLEKERNETRMILRQAKNRIMDDGCEYFKLEDLERILFQENV